MKTNSVRKVVSFLSSLSILLNSFAPFILITPQTAFSQEPLKNTITYNNSKGVFHFEVNNKDAAVTSGPISYSLLYRNELTGQVQNVNGSTDLSDSNFTRDIDVATCSSGGACVPHVVSQGIMKVKVESANWFDSQWFKIENGGLVVKSQFNSGDVMDLSSDEQNWLNTGEGPAPTPTPTVEPTATPTVEPTATPTEVPTPTATIIPTAIPQLGDEEVQVKVVKLDGSYADPNLVPATWTDKADYAPTEKVVVSGKNFIANYEYTIVISSSDDPAVTHTGTFTALADGTFTYEYQLDGHYRPNYKVEIKDATGIVVAGTTFTDDEPVPVTENPTLTQACGLDIALVLDVSGSISSGELTSMKNAFTGMVDALNGTPTQFSVTKFDTTASILQSFTSDFPLTKTKIESASGGNFTNWEAGLTKSYSTFDPRPTKPNLIIFASDGNPNMVGTGTNASEAQAVNKAKIVANSAKTAGTRILTIGIGNDLDTNNLKAISGNSMNTGNVLTSDVITTDFAGLATQLGNFAKQTCGGKISINKYVDGVQKSDGQTWSFKLDGTTTLTADGNGQVASGTLSVGNHSVSEVSIPSGYSYDHATCTSGVNDPTNQGIKDIAVTADSIITCNFYNTTNKGSITIVKDTQPNDAQDFAFTAIGTGVSNFSLDDDDANATLSNTKTFSNLMPGSFTFVEGTTSGWTLDSITCGTGGTVDLVNRKATIVITPGLNVTCTYVNKPKYATLTLNKTVVNTNGGTKAASDFGAYIDGNTVSWGVATDVLPNEEHTVTEGSLAHYTPSNWGTNCSANGKITLLPGENKVCTITNTYAPYCGDGYKTATEECDDGNSVNTDSCLNTCKIAKCGDEVKSATEECDDGNLVNTDACTNACKLPTCGDGYLYSGVEECDRGYLNKDTACTAPYGGSCTYCNKSCSAITVTGPSCGDGVINGTEQCDGTNLGGLSATDFRCNSCSLELITPKVTICHATSSQKNPYIVNTPDKSGDVSGHDGHDGPVWYPGITVDWGDIIPAFAYIGGTYPGQNWTTEGQAIYNNGCELPKAKLIVKKVVVNDNGGTKGVTDFSFKVGTASAVVFEADGQNDLSVDPGIYTITEPADSQYAATYDNCSNVTIPIGGTATCTITNNDNAASLTLTKVVINDNGGTKTASNFPVQIDGVTKAWGTQAVNAGAHTVSETSQTGYSASSWGGDCSTTGEVTLLPGQSKTCTITNDDDAPTLKLVKSVTNNDGGTVLAGGWNLTAAGTVLGFTDKGDSTDFHTVKAGVAYTLSESTVAGYTSAGWSCDGGSLVEGKVTLGVGENVTCTVTNNDVAPKLTLIKKVTTDNGGTAKPDDFNLTVGGTSVTSGEKNTFAANTPYAINETQQDGYSFVSITGTGCPTSLGDTITLKPGDDKTCTITNDDDAPSLTLKKEVVNDNGGRAVPTDWTLTATGPTTLSGKGIATSEGTFAAGTYTLTESGPTGYTAGPWSCTGVDVDTRDGSRITLSPGQSTVCTITNDDIAPKVTLIKKILGQEGIGDLNFGLTVGGNAVTSGVPLEVKANTPVSLNEEGLPGYQFVAMHGTGEEDQCPEVLGGTVILNEGQNVSCTITNQYVPAELTIAKYNTTWPNTTTPGGEVQYTLKLKVSKNNINNLLVVDLPANGFKYKPGSYHVTIGGVDATASIAEPQYHSPGQWKLGDINLGENDEVEILLSYTATVDPNQKPGLYKDLAWAYGSEAGVNAESTRLLASSTDAGTADPGVITEQFVGSKVAVNKETQNSTSVSVVTKQESTGEVLGASTSLPSTGASTVWTYIISLLMGLGSLSIFMGIALKKRLFKKITLFSIALLLVTSVFAVPHAVQAADSDLTIRISEPKTPINQTFDLIFVALDMQQTRPLTVKCYKKGPSDGVYSQFGSDIAVIAGGNSGKCDITDSLLSQKGTYYFYTTVEADLGPVTSQTVAVDYNSTDGPGTPTNYAKDHISSCQNKISFKTSDDGGKTVKVEVYRNENTSFGVDSSNRVTSIGIGSNTDGSYTDTVPDCNKTYYYVIRAFDTAGNGSGVIGDSVVTITNSSTTTTTTTTTTAAAGRAIPVAGGNIPDEASVLGEETSATKEAKAQGEVLGQKAEAQKKSVGSNILSVLTDKKMRPWYIAIALLAVGIIGYVIYKKRNQNETETPEV